MKTNDESMSASQAVGYIVGVGLGLLRRHYRAVAILIGLGGTGLILGSIFSNGVFIGASMIAGSVALWLLFSSRGS